MNGFYYLSVLLLVFWTITKPWLWQTAIVFRWLPTARSSSNHTTSTTHHLPPYHETAWSLWAHLSSTGVQSFKRGWRTGPLIKDKSVFLISFLYLEKLILNIGVGINLRSIFNDICFNILRQVIMTLFERCFGQIYRFALQNLVFKMRTLEAFVIQQCIGKKMI